MQQFHVLSRFLIMQHLSKDELLALLREAKASRERDWLMILVAYWHGLRASEVIAITPDDIRDGHLDVQRLKGSLRTIQPLIEHPDPLLSEAQPLFDFARKINPKSNGYQSLPWGHFWRLVQRYAAAAGIPAHKRHPHVLKHSIAMQTIQSAGIGERAAVSRPQVHFIHRGLLEGL